MPRASPFSEMTTSTTQSRTSAAVSSGVHAFLSGLIDYAGLFPPARLSLDEAVPNYAAYQQSEDAWMLSRFICPAGRLRELSGYAERFEPDTPLAVSVLGSGGSDADAFLRALAADLEAVQAFENAHGARVQADLMEVRLPDAVVETGSDAVASLLMQVGQLVADAGVAFERVHFEAGFVGDWRRTVGGAVDALTRHSVKNGLAVGYKVRCGGVTADAFPTPEQVAFVIARCRDARLPFKATAGLHHPVRRFDHGIGAMMHGFLNVFGAGVLAHALDLTEPAIRQVLRNEAIKAFALDEAGFAFQDLRITPEQVAEARAALATSYGSCSFDEPRDDLRAAGLL